MKQFNWKFDQITGVFSQKPIHKDLQSELCFMHNCFSVARFRIKSKIGEIGSFTLLVCAGCAKKLGEIRR